MAKKQSLATALQSHEHAPQPRRAKAISTAAPGRAEKKAVMGYFDTGVSKQLKLMAAEKESSIQNLLQEALNDLFQKYKKPTIA